MAKIDELKKTIETLPAEEYGKLRQWFSERDWERWDEQIELDSKSGKLDFLWVWIGTHDEYERMIKESK